MTPQSRLTLHEQESPREQRECRNRQRARDAERCIEQIKTYLSARPGSWSGHAVLTMIADWEATQL